MLKLFRSEVTRLMLAGFVVGALAVGATQGVAQAEPSVQADSRR